MSATILLVDDDPDVLDLIADMLRDLGWDVVPVQAGQDALRVLGSDDSIEVLLTDLNMPGMDGRELAERALLAKPALRVLQLSGREAGLPYLPMIRKPFTQDDLALAMKQTVGLK